MCIGTCLVVNRNFAGFAGLVAVALGTLTAAAQEVSVVLPQAKDVAVGGLTYGELVELALPGASASGNTITVPEGLALRHIEGPDFSVTLPVPVKVQSIEAVRVSVEARPHLAMLIELSETDASLGPVAGLALFDISAEPRLVDIADVGFDRLVTFAVPPSLRVGAGHDLLLVGNMHGNAGQFYDATTIVDVVDGRLKLVDVVMTLSDQGCAGSRTQSVRYEAAGDEGAARAPFRVSVTDATDGPVGPCEDAEPFEPAREVYTVTYAWDEAAGQYLSERSGWAALDEVNSERY